MHFNIFLYNYTCFSKFLYFKFNSNLSFIKSYFYVFCKLNQNSFQLFSIYYLLICILELNILSLSIKQLNTKNLSILIIYSKITILSLLLKLLYLYFPFLDSFKLDVKISDALVKTTYVVNLNFFHFPLLFELDIFYDLGIELIDLDFIKHATTFFFKRIQYLNNKLIIFFFLNFLKIPFKIYDN